MAFITNINEIFRFVDYRKINFIRSKLKSYPIPLSVTVHVNNYIINFNLNT